MAVSEELLRQLASMSAGRKPSWVTQGEYDASSAFLMPLADGTDGVSVEGYLLALLQVEPRKNPRTREVQIQILAKVTGEDYNCVITIDDATDSTNSYTALAGDTVNDIADGLALDINTNSTKCDATAAGDTITIIRDDADRHGDFFTDTSTSTTPANLDTIWADATSVTFSVFGQADNVPAGEARHELIPGLESIVVNWKGWTDRVVVSGYKYIYVFPTDADGNYTVRIGPCILEEGLS